MIDPSTRAATQAAGPARDSELRFRFLYTASAVGSLLAAAAVAVVRSVHPFDHGWWLMSYLALVGGASQLLLGAGRLMLAATTASALGRRTAWERRRRRPSGGAAVAVGG